jgi:hypothetical protein
MNAPARRSFVAEMTILALLFAAAGVGSFWYAATFVGATGKAYHLYPKYSDSPILIALGQGLRVAAEGAITDPAYLRFKNQESNTLDAKVEIASSLTRAPEPGDKFLYDRLYLVYAMGWTWRLLGLSWSNLNYLMALVYGVSAVFLYGIFRLGMRRPLSALLTTLVLLSPAMLGELPALREFMKVPFFLGAIFISGVLFSRVVSRRVYWVLAIGGGLLAGIGVGFRQDAIICLPPICAAVLLAAGGLRHISVVRRMAAVLAVLAAFLPAAWPALRMQFQSGGNNAFYLSQGFARGSFNATTHAHLSSYWFYSISDQVLYATLYCHNLNQPQPTEWPYARFARYTSDYLFASGLFRMPLSPVEGGLALLLSKFPVFRMPGSEELYSAAERLNTPGFTIWDDEEEAFTRSIVSQAMWTQPADVLTRWYASALCVVRHLGTARYELPYPKNDMLQRLEDLLRPLSGHLASMGALYACVALLLISLRSVWLALTCFGFILYFGGYPSLSFQFRHVVHLQFVSYWLAGYVVQQLFCVTAHLYRKRGALSRAAIWSVLNPRPLWRPLLFVFCVGFLVGAPLAVAHQVQTGRMAGLQTRFRNLPLAPVAVAVNGDRYTPKRLLGFETWSDALSSCLPWNRWFITREPAIVMEYLVVEVETDGVWGDIALDYADSEESWMKGDFPVVCAMMQGKHVFRCCFPVFKSRHYYPLPEFRGFRLPPCLKFRQLYRVTDQRALPFPMTICLPDDPRLFIDHMPLQDWTGQ